MTPQAKVSSMVAIILLEQVGGKGVVRNPEKLLDR
jgi:hypothetical protein